MQQTLVTIKPDAIERRLVGEIISRFERAGFEIVRAELRQPDADLFRRFYAEHEGRPHFARLMQYMLSGPSFFLQLRRDDAVETARALVGATDPASAASGTIRGDLGLALPRNSVHASDSAQAAAREIALVFDAEAAVEPGDAAVAH